VPIRVDPEVGKDWGHVKGRVEKRVKVVDGKEVAVERTLTMEQFIKRTIKEAKIACRSNLKTENYLLLHALRRYAGGDNTGILVNTCEGVN
jgi:hypothetical protein